MNYATETEPIQPYACLPVDIPQLTVDKAYANDYDATLGMTGKLPRNGEPVLGAMGLLLATAGSDRYDIDPDNIVAEWQSCEDSAGSFDSLGTVRKSLSAEDYAAFCREYRANQQGIELMYPDAQPYLDRLNQTPTVPNFVLTYGEHEWQTLKTSTANIPGHVEITREKSKGKVIESLRDPSNPEGSFDLVAVSAANEAIILVRAKKITLVDDKPGSFGHMPLECDNNYYIDRGETKKKSQTGSVDLAQVRTCHSLDQLEISPASRHPYSARASALLSRAIRFMPVASFDDLH